MHPKTTTCWASLLLKKSDFFAGPCLQRLPSSGLEAPHCHALIIWEEQNHNDKLQLLSGQLAAQRTTWVPKYFSAQSGWAHKHLWEQLLVELIDLITNNEATLETLPHQHKAPISDTGGPQNNTAKEQCSIFTRRARGKNTLCCTRSKKKARKGDRQWMCA